MYIILNSLKDKIGYGMGMDVTSNYDLHGAKELLRLIKTYFFF